MPETSPIEQPSLCDPRRIGFASYRVLPRAAGWSYLVSVLLGRLPLSMAPLAVLTLATAATGSIAIGGLCAAAAAFAEAVGAPLTGFLADLLGQRPVLLAAVVLHVAAFVAFAFAAGVLPDATTVALAAATGLVIPQVGALSRARWLAITPREVPVAFAFEGVLDEISYIIGPALVGIIAVVADPHAAVFVACLLIAVFATWFAVHPTHRLVPRRRDLGASRRSSAPGARAVAARRRLLIAIAFSGTLSMGFFFGGSQTGLTAFAEEQGIPNAGALLYASMAVGSAITTLAMVLVPPSIGLWTRWMWAAAGLTLGVALMLTATSVPAIVVWATLAGAFQGPLLLTIFSVAGSVTEAGKGGFVMTLVGSGVLVGVGASAAAGGVLADSFGSAGGLGLVLVASIVQLLLGVGATVLARRRGAS